MIKTITANQPIPEDLRKKMESEQARQQVSPVRVLILCVVVLACAMAVYAVWQG